MEVMQTVVFEGKEYTKASVLAERFRYTQDYLGQLCRAKKVDARLVGRAWYVNLDSLELHRKSRYKTEQGEPLVKAVADESEEKSNQPVVNVAAPVITKKASNHYLSRIDVEPVLRQKTVKILQNEAGKLKELPVRYERDDFSLIPKVNRTAISTALPISIAEADEISVKKTKEHIRITDFKAEPLPEIYLKGKIGVVGIPEATEKIEEQIKKETEMEAFSIDQQVPRKVTIVKKQTPEDKSHPVGDGKKSLKIKLISGKLSPKQTVKIHTEKNKEPLANVSVDKLLVKREEIKPLKPNEIRVVTAATPDPVQINQSLTPHQKEQKVSRLETFLSVVVVFVACVIATLIILGKTVIEVGPAGTSSIVSFDVSQAKLLVEKIKSLR